MSTKTRKVKDDLPPIKRNNMLAIENMILQAIENKYGAEETANDDTNENETHGGDSEEGVDGGSVKQDMDDTFFLTQVIIQIAEIPLMPQIIYIKFYFFVLFSVLISILAINKTNVVLTFGFECLVANPRFS